MAGVTGGQDSEPCPTVRWWQPFSRPRFSSRATPPCLSSRSPLSYQWRLWYKEQLRLKLMYERQCMVDEEEYMREVRGALCLS